MGNWMMTPERVARVKRLGILPVANPPFLFFLGDPMVEMLQRRATEQGVPCDCVGRAAQFNGLLPLPHVVGRGVPLELWVRLARLLSGGPAA